MHVSLRTQPGLQTLGFGTYGEVYNVDDHVVLKSPRVFIPPQSAGSATEKWLYASDSIFHFNLMRNERIVLRLLEQRPHPNLVEPINTDCLEGVYLRKYLTLSQIPSSTQQTRITWYQDIIKALQHLHDVGIAHGDVRIDNILFNDQGRAVLCDFSAACPFGHPNPGPGYSPNLPFPTNGIADVFSDATDRFALASLMFYLEVGRKPDLAVDSDGVLVLPLVATQHEGVDCMIKKAWLGQYTSTAQMLEDTYALCYPGARHPTSTTHTVPRKILRDRVRDWRTSREDRYGCVIDGLPTEDELSRLRTS
ncbi:kinase-like domain-containing protein [Aspergillus carlsbadensis]|nr:kinase-like domain-containing protein [Aspergillus carlsbadensis]